MMTAEGDAAHPQPNNSVPTSTLYPATARNDGPVASLDGPSAPLEAPAHSTIPSTTGPVGEPGLPPSRPASTATAPSSRAGPGARTSTGRGLSVVSSGDRSTYQSSATSRPTTAATAASRTHVPNLISSAFLKPINQSRGQSTEQYAQPQAAVAPLPAARRSMESGRRSHRHRNSNASLVTLEGQPRPLVDADAPPVPTSRGTGTTSPGAAFETPPPFGRSGTADSAVPLQSFGNLGAPAPLDLSKARSASLYPQKSPKSQRSLSASWGRPSKGDRQRGQSGNREGLEKLASEPPSPAYPTKNHPPTRSDLGRNYEYFNGNAVFFLSGRLINSRQRPLNLMTGLLAVLPVVLFFIFSAPWLWHNVSPAIPIIFAYIFFVCMSSFLQASFSDPGIIPRNLHPLPPPPDNEDPLAIGPPTTEWVTVRSFANSADGNTTAMEVPIKYCKACNIWRPPRAHHCRVCDSCIETQDHHCVWLNNCVGRRNYRYFLTFVASGTLLGFYLLGATLAHILVWRTRHHATFGHAVNVWRVPFAMFIYAIIIVPYPASLWGYHLFLMGRGETTREYLNGHKFQKRDRHRPFSQHSVIKNWISVVMRPRPPSYLQFKRRYQAGDQRLGDTRSARKIFEKKENRPPKLESSDEVGMEMKEMPAVPDAPGSASGSQLGFQGPRGRGNINNTPRGDVTGPGSPGA